MPAERAVAALLIAASLPVLGGGCTGTQAVGATGTLAVGLTEYRLTPEKAHAPAGRLTFVVHNFGRLTHNLAVINGTRIAAETAPIQPGAIATLTLYLAPGTYTMASNFLEDQSLGVSGSLSVTG